MRRPWKLFRRDESGGIVLVEFALVVPMLFLVIAAIIDFSRAHYVMNAMVAAVREGGRYVAVQTTPASKQAEVQSKVNSYWAAFGLQALDSVQLTTTASTVTVRAVYTFRPFTALRAWPIPFARQATFRWERCGAAC